MSEVKLVLKVCLDGVVLGEKEIDIASTIDPKLSAAIKEMIDVEIRNDFLRCKRPSKNDLLMVLKKTGQIKKTAQLCKVHPTTINAWMERYSITKRDYKLEEKEEL